MRALGIDIGLRTTGYAIMDNKNIIECATIEPDPSSSIAERLQFIYRSILKVVQNFHPDVACIETVFYSKNPKTLSLLSQVKGVILLACANAKTEIYEFTPAEIKMALTGNGRADKSQVRFMVENIVHTKIPSPYDISDAIACALCYVLRSDKSKIS
jgi:crossover junction endodeoxyribonuclease RuvC